jgi:hypothetical protein
MAKNILPRVARVLIEKTCQAIDKNNDGGRINSNFVSDAKTWLPLRPPIKAEPLSGGHQNARHY